MLAWVAAECEPGGSGIVYCLTRKDTVAVADLINASGQSTAAHYHADMDPLVRQQVHQLWSSGTPLLERPNSSSGQETRLSHAAVDPVQGLP
jgi:superfamily II DNA helicase RecQ